MQVGTRRGGLNANKGMNTNKFLIAVGAALIVFFLCILGWSSWSAHSARPSVNGLGKAGDGATATQKGGPGR